MSITVEDLDRRLRRLELALTGLGASVSRSGPPPARNLPNASWAFDTCLCWPYYGVGTTMPPETSFWDIILFRQTRFPVNPACPHAAQHLEVIPHLDSDLRELGLRDGHLFPVIRAGYRTVRQVAYTTDVQLMRIPNVGVTIVKTLRDAIERHPKTRGPRIWVIQKP